MSDHVQFTYSKITDSIFVGSNMCCTTHAAQLMALGIVADVDLEILRPEEPPQLPVYLWLPTVDHAAPTQQQLAAGAACIASVVASGGAVYVHCQNGHGRSPSMVAAYLTTTGLTPAAAFDLIRAQRPEIHPEASQVGAVEAFAEAQKIN